MFARHRLFLVGRPFSFSPAGRLSMRWVGPSSASLRLAPVCSRVRRGLLQRDSCMSAGLGGAHFLSSFSDILVVPRANHPFSACFSAFPDGDSKVCVCVCLCVCVCVCPSHSAAPFPDFLHLDFVQASTRTRHPPAFCDNLAILTVVNPFSTRRWLGTKVGTLISL